MESVYVAGGSCVKEYRPPASITYVLEMPVWVLFSFTVACGTTAPEGSVTLPLNVAVVTASWACPPKGKASSSRSANASPLFSNSFIVFNSASKNCSKRPARLPVVPRQIRARGTYRQRKRELAEQRPYRWVYLASIRSLQQEREVLSG